MSYHFNEEEARDEYEKMKPSLIKHFNFKGHWNDKKKVNKFNREVLIKGDKERFLKHYKKNIEVIEKANKLTIDDLVDDGIN